VAVVELKGEMFEPFLCFRDGHQSSTRAVASLETVYTKLLVLCK